MDQKLKMILEVYQMHQPSEAWFQLIMSVEGKHR